MSNYSVMDANYNLTAILSNDLVTNPNNWAVAFNNELAGVFFISLLVIIGIVIFMGLKSTGTVQTDSEALSFAGLVVTISGIFFLVVGLVEWLWLVPIFVITAIALYLNFTNRNY